ncbi:MAG: ABC transporter permease [Pyrinomonadaceae bacterium]
MPATFSRKFFSRSFGIHFARRLAQSTVLVVLLIVFNFFIIHIAPGDPVDYLAGQSGDQEYYDLIRAKFGLDQPFLTQLWVYLSSVLRGDLGYSLSHQQPVIDVILSRTPATLMLVIPAIAIATFSGIVLGVESARRQNSRFDRFVNAFALLGHSLPSFSIGMFLLLLLSLQFGLFPAQGATSANKELQGLGYAADFLLHLALPCLTLVIVQLAQILRIMRTEMIEVLNENYINAARAKGLGEERVLYIHALRGALIPVATIIGSDLGMLLSGAVLIETVFAYPGLGRLMLEAIAARDYPVLLGLLIITSVSVALANFVIDTIYPLLDPRIK